MCALSVSSKYNADWDFLCGLRDKGRREAETWLAKNYRNIGQRSSIDIRKCNSLVASVITALSFVTSSRL